MKKKEKIKLISIVFVPLLLLIIMWLIKIIEYSFNISFSSYGVSAKELKGLRGIIFSPFIHKDFNHLLNNSYPIIILGSILFSFYKNIAYKILLWIFFTSGLFLWVIGRPGFHIGASGIIYSLASFLFLSGVIRKSTRLSSISLLIIFLYGSMIWGVLPTSDPISWEGHLSGLFSGVLIALFYKKQGPQRKKYQWEIDEELEDLQEEG